ncbi:hypothetical protein Nos7524_3414 [Nostoc sp. PCC 7524]|nr:hypothetical protein Nos7524_3414 [Nostoc sp. PCC 7524]
MGFLYILSECNGMKINKRKPTNPQQLNCNKAQIQLLNLKQLDSVTGGQSQTAYFVRCDRSTM